MKIMLNGYIIRPLVQNDIELARVVEVYRQCEDFLSLGPVATASLNMVETDLAYSRQQGGTFCVIEQTENSELVGVVDYVNAGFEGDPELAFLSLLMIAAPYRNQGLGTSIVREVEEIIRINDQVKAIHSGVQVNNPFGIRFWQSVGYSIISGEEPMEDGTIVFRLWKKIR